MKMHFPQLALLCLVAGLVSGCGSDTIEIGEGAISAPLPNQLRGIAAIDPSDLLLEVTVNDESPTRVTRQGGDTWAASIDIPINQSNQIYLGWYTTIDGTKVLLADFETQVGSGQQELNVTSYNDSGSEFDIDNDGRSNLSELRDHRNVLDRIDYEIPFSNATFLSPSLGFHNVVDDEATGNLIANDTENSRFSVWHDNQTLKFLVCVDDSEIHSDGGSSTSTTFEYWHDDAVEIYLDAGNDATQQSTFDTTNDFQFVYTPEPGRTDRYSNDINLSNNSGQRPICPDGSCSTHNFSSSANCNYELSVQLDMAALGLSAGSEFGLDVEILDDDDGGLREGKYVWIGHENDSFQRPYSFGKVRLE